MFCKTSNDTTFHKQTQTNERQTNKRKQKQKQKQTQKCQHQETGLFCRQLRCHQLTLNNTNNTNTELYNRRVYNSVTQTLTKTTTTTTSTATTATYLPRAICCGRCHYYKTDARFKQNVKLGKKWRTRHVCPVSTCKSVDICGYEAGHREESRRWRRPRRSWRRRSSPAPTKVASASSARTVWVCTCRRRSSPGCPGPQQSRGP